MGRKTHLIPTRGGLRSLACLPFVKHLFPMSRLKVQTSVNNKPVCAHNLMN